MLQTILVPTDGSSLAARAIPFATRLGRITAARVILVRAHLPDGDALDLRLSQPDLTQPSAPKASACGPSQSS
jgi:nucleotide-binding universal stress UspA family protein